MSYCVASSALEVRFAALGVASGSQMAVAYIDGLFSPIIERGSVLPVSRVHPFRTLAEGQKKILIQVYQGEHSLCAQNQKLGQYELTGVPPGPAGQELVEVRFSYDMNGVLNVDATIVSTGKSATFTIESVPGRLSKKALEETRSRLKRLKFHPREALPNVTALARADALYVEVTGADRAKLGACINGLRLALETQDPVPISAQRLVLLRMSSELDRE